MARYEATSGVGVPNVPAPMPPAGVNNVNVIPNVISNDTKFAEPEQLSSTQGVQQLSQQIPKNKWVSQAGISVASVSASIAKTSTNVTTGVASIGANFISNVNSAFKPQNQTPRRIVSRGGGRRNGRLGIKNSRIRDSDSPEICSHW